MNAGCSCDGGGPNATHLACGPGLFCGISSTPAELGENGWSVAPNREWPITTMYTVCIVVDYCNREDPWPLFVNVDWADQESIDRSQYFYYNKCHGDVYNNLNVL